jgi:hypothetical protein
LLRRIIARRSVFKPGWGFACMQRLDAWAQGPLPSGVSWLVLRPHAVFHPRRKEAAIGFEALVLYRRDTGEAPTVLDSRRLDSVVPAQSDCEAHFQATLHALVAIQDLPAVLREVPLRIAVQDVHVGRVLSMLQWPTASENVPSEVVPWRLELLRFFDTAPRRPYVEAFFPREGQRSKLYKKRFGALEKRLLSKAWGLKRRPSPGGITVDVEELGRRLNAAGWNPRTSPPLLGVLVAALNDAGHSFDDVSQALGIDKRRLYEAKARWKQALASAGSGLKPENPP